MDKYRHTNQREDLNLTMTALRCAVFSPFHNLQAAKRWAKLADDGNDGSALEAYWMAINRLCYFVVLAPDVQSQQQVITRTSDHLALRRVPFSWVVWTKPMNRNAITVRLTEISPPMDCLKRTRRE